MLLLALFLLLSTPLRAAEPEKVDLSDQFPDAALRSQGNTGSCHIFTSVSLLEAALYRRWKLRLPLSEADLFVRKIIEKPDYYDEVKQRVQDSHGTSTAYELDEGGFPADDLEFAMAKGVALAKTVSWAEFEARYIDFRFSDLGWIKRHQQPLVDSEHDKTQTQTGLDTLGQEEGDGQKDSFVGLDRSLLLKIKSQAGKQAGDARKRFIDFLDQGGGKSPALVEKLLLGEDPQIAKDRAVVKDLSSGFTVKKKSFAYKAAKRPADALCAAAGAAQKALLLFTLRRGLPMSIAMDIGGLSAWDMSYKPEAHHAFTILGFELDSQGQMTLKSRNSWGKKNPDVPENQFCRITAAAIVTTGQDK